MITDNTIHLTHISNAVFKHSKGTKLEQQVFSLLETVNNRETVALLHGQGQLDFILLWQNTTIQKRHVNRSGGKMRTLIRHKNLASQLPSFVNAESIR